MLYLNVFNNINIKVNDQYKISRYLFDNVIRKGIREYAPALKSPAVDGMSFSIIATDKNFIKEKDDPNVSLYSFYLPQKEILLYIDDDITGRELADHSYILVNNERIELR